MSLTLAALALAAAPADASTLATPDGPWSVDYGDRQCLAMRTFDHAALGRLALAFKPDMLGKKGQLLVKFVDPPAMPMLDEARWNLPGAPSTPQSARVAMGDLANGEKLAAAMDFYPDNATTHVPGRIDFAAQDEVVLTLEVPEARALETALRDCMVDLWAEHDLTPDLVERPVTAPSPHIASTYEARDYPRAALDRSISGTVPILYVVNAEGRIERCEVWQSSGHEILDEPTCEVLVRRYRASSPPRDAAGNAVSGAYIFPVVWRISDR